MKFDWNDEGMNDLRCVIGYTVILLVPAPRDAGMGPDDIRLFGFSENVKILGQSTASRL